MIRSSIALLSLFLAVPPLRAAELQVSALHPLLADVARQVGGNRVIVHDLMGAGTNAHRYEPRPADLKKMQDSKVILAAGKNMESYLGRLKDTMKHANIVEVGRTIPSLTVGKDVVYTCCPQHGAGAIDPHWWHGVENMRRASRVIADSLSTADPEGKAVYQANATAYGQKLEQLKRWAKTELAKVPREQRKLVTAHNAFAYFAKEFGFEVIAVAGLTNEQNNTPQELAKTIESIKKAGVRAVFPEEGYNEKTVRSIAKTAGVTVAEPLISDGNAPGHDTGFEAMIRHNVRVITTVLGSK
ncbi:MAG: zinc ABC transporter substrate-binding protein [Verrucomicrobia bacterium]|nr:zinc ABC transporter substrate-binding protein [Verrucomicrobiota bacterium]